MHTSPNDQKCPKPEETQNTNNPTTRNTQRCHQRRSLSEFRSRFKISPTPIPSDHQRQFANALTTSHPVWEKESDVTPTLLSRLQPFQPGRTVRRPPSNVTQTKETRRVTPSEVSLGRLRQWKIDNGEQKEVEMKLERLSPDLSEKIQESNNNNNLQSEVLDLQRQQLDEIEKALEE